MVYSLEGPVSFYNNDNFKASALPSLILYFNWYEWVPKLVKYGWGM